MFYDSDCSFMKPHWKEWWSACCLLTHTTCPHSFQEQESDLRSNAWISQTSNSLKWSSSPLWAHRSEWENARCIWPTLQNPVGCRSPGLSCCVKGTSISSLQRGTCPRPSKPASSLLAPQTLRAAQRKRNSTCCPPQNCLSQTCLK